MRGFGVGVRLRDEAQTFRRRHWKTWNLSSEKLAGSTDKRRQLTPRAERVI